MRANANVRDARTRKCVKQANTYKIIGVEYTNRNSIMLTDAKHVTICFARHFCQIVRYDAWCCEKWGALQEMSAGYSEMMQGSCIFFKTYLWNAGECCRKMRRISVFNEILRYKSGL